MYLRRPRSKRDSFEIQAANRRWVNHVPNPDRVLAYVESLGPYKLRRYIRMFGLDPGEAQDYEGEA